MALRLLAFPPGCDFPKRSPCVLARAAGRAGRRGETAAPAELGAERLGLLLADRHGKIGGFGEDAGVNEDTLVTPGQVVRSSRR